MSRCTATTKKNTQCKNAAINGSAYCGVHQSATYCTGVTLKNEPCKAQQVPGSLFCSKHQKQTVDTSPITDCTVFRMDDLLNLKRSAVVEYRDSLDVYTGQAISQLCQSNLDHVVELNLLRDCFDRVSGTSEDKALLKHNVRSAASIVPNLNFTTQSINQMKHCAVRQFCDDFENKQCHLDGLRFYLQQQRLTEDTRVKISEETAQSLDAITCFLTDHDEMCGNICDMMEKMVL